MLAAYLIKLLQLIVQIRILHVEILRESDGHGALAAKAVVDECVVGVTWSRQKDSGSG